MPKAHGLGMYLKRLTIGDPTSFDFCSTHLFYDRHSGKVKITRQLNRTMILNQYSDSLHRCINKYHAKMFFEQMAAETESWAEGLDVFGCYPAAWRYIAKQINYAPIEKIEYEKALVKQQKITNKESTLTFLSDPGPQCNVAKLPHNFLRVVINEYESNKVSIMQSFNRINPLVFRQLLKEKYQLSNQAIDGYAYELLDRSEIGLLIGEMTTAFQMKRE
jgi:hypothetical protein